MERQGAILITGGTNGIGFATAVEMAEMGYRNFILGYHKSDTAAAAAKATLEQYDGIKVSIIKGDVAECQTIEAYFQTIDKHFDGCLYAIAHTAGKYVTVDTNDLESTLDYYHEMYSKAFFRLIERGIPYLEKSPCGGRILTVSTPGCNMMASPRPSYFLPGCAKAALEYIARHYAQLLAPKLITCNVIVPGITDTAAWMTTTPPTDATRLAETRCPMKKIIPASDVGAAAAFLLSERAGFITGVILPVCGGLMFV